MTKIRQSRYALAELAAATYAALTGHPGESPESLAITLNVPVQTVDEVLKLLERAGYARKQPSNPILWEARDPQTAQVFRIGHIRELMNEISERLDASEVLAGSILASPKPFSFLQQDVEGISRIPDSSSAYSLVSEMNNFARNCTASILTRVPSPEELEISFSEEQEMRSRGIIARAIFPDKARTLEYVLDYAEKVQKLGGEIRVTPVDPIRMLIWDQSVALIRGSSKTADSVTLFIETPSITKILSQYFELLWEESSPILDQSNVVLSDNQRNIIKGLLSGESESRIAKATGLSASTVHRTIDHLQKIAGVNGRFALGAAAERRGWIPTRPDRKAKGKEE